MQVRAYLKKEGQECPTVPVHDDHFERAMQLRMLSERLYTLLEDTHKIGMGYLLPVAFRLVHESKMDPSNPPRIHDLLDELDGQELLNFDHATGLFFGDEPEPDIDEPDEDDYDPAY